MSDRSKKISNQKTRTARTRSKINGTSSRPRMTVFISNKNISVQIIDDGNGTTLTSCSSLKYESSLTMTEKATKLGEEVALKAKKSKITKVVLDRGSKQYHGRIKALADSARNNGMEL